MVRPLRAFIATPQSATVITLDINHLDVNDVRLDLKLRNGRVRVCPRFVRIAQNGQVASRGLTERGTAQHNRSRIRPRCRRSRVEQDDASCFAAAALARCRKRPSALPSGTCGLRMSSGNGIGRARHQPVVVAELGAYALGYRPRHSADTFEGELKDKRSNDPVT